LLAPRLFSQFNEIMGTDTLDVKLGALQVRATDSKNAEILAQLRRR
jgi:hypothetical protein